MTRSAGGSKGARNPRGQSSESHGERPTGTIRTGQYATEYGSFGGIVEGAFGLFARYWRPLITHTVIAAIGFSLLKVDANSIAGGSRAADFDSPANWTLGAVSLVVCLVVQALDRGGVKQLSFLFGGNSAAFVLNLVMPKEPSEATKGQTSS